MLNSTQLHDLFRAAQVKDQINNCKLLISHLSDLFQIEASYFFDGQDLQLLLHILMASSDSVLHLFQLHPFPLPFTESHFLLPKTIQPNLCHLNQYGSTFQQALHGQPDGLSQGQLHEPLQRAWHSQKVTELHLLELALLAGLHMAMALCDMEIITQKETVLELQDNWYLVHCPKAFTGHVICWNSSNSEVFLKPGANHFYISPSCRYSLEIT